MKKRPEFWPSGMRMSLENKTARYDGCSDRTVSHMVAAAWSLPPLMVLSQKIAPERSRRHLSEKLLKHEEEHPGLLENVTEWTIQHRFPKEPNLPTLMPPQKLLMTKTKVKKIDLPLPTNTRIGVKSRGTRYFLAMKATLSISDHNMERSYDLRILAATHLILQINCEIPRQNFCVEGF